MLITSHFVFVHFKKTGGRFIRAVCADHLPAGWIVATPLRDHAPAREIPPRFADLPVMGLVRNPWDWYVSWYHNVRDVEQRRPKDLDPGSVWAVVFDEGRASFEEAIHAACTGVPVNGRPAPPWMTGLRAESVDLYTRWCDRMFRAGVARRVEIGCFEHLREEFTGFLERHHVPVPDDFADRVMRAPPENETERGPYPSYYDRELQELVRSRCRLVGEYGYSFED